MRGMNAIRYGVVVPVFGQTPIFFVVPYPVAMQSYIDDDWLAALLQQQIRYKFSIPEADPVPDYRIVDRRELKGW